MAVPRGSGMRAEAPVHRWRLCDGEWPRVLRQYRVQAGRRRRRRAVSVSAKYRALARPVARYEPDRHRGAAFQSHRITARRAQSARSASPRPCRWRARPGGIAPRQHDTSGRGERSHAFRTGLRTHALGQQLPLRQRRPQPGSRYQCTY